MPCLCLVFGCRERCTVTALCGHMSYAEGSITSMPPDQVSISLYIEMLCISQQ